MARTHRKPKRNGSVLILGCLTFVVLALLIIIGCSFANLYFVNNRLQTAADEIALAGAQTLNYHDQIGQVNNMIARCRGLVYASQKCHDDVTADFPFLTGLADELREEARASATNLETHRANLRDQARNRARAAMIAKFSEIQPTFTMVLPWLRSEMTETVGMRLGKMNGVESNVAELGGLDGLASSDRGSGLIEAAFGLSGVSLYKTGNARLPGSNSDLDFKLSSLDAPVQGTVSPARVIQRQTFNAFPGGGDEIPSATQARLTLSVGTGLGPEGRGKVEAIGSAETTGADRQQ